MFLNSFSFHEATYTRKNMNNYNPTEYKKNEYRHRFQITSPHYIFNRIITCFIKSSPSYSPPPLSPASHFAIEPPRILPTALQTQPFPPVLVPSSLALRFLSIDTWGLGLRFLGKGKCFKVRVRVRARISRLGLGLRLGIGFQG